MTCPAARYYYYYQSYYYYAAPQYSTYVDAAYC